METFAQKKSIPSKIIHENGALFSLKFEFHLIEQVCELCEWIELKIHNKWTDSKTMLRNAFIVPKPLQLYARESFVLWN